MKLLLTILIILTCASCTVFKPKATPTPTTQEKVPDVMSRSIPKIPSLPTIPTKDLTTVMRDSVYKMALRMDTILYGYYTTARGQSKVIDELLKFKVDSRGVIDSLVKDNRKIKEDFDKFKITWFSSDFEVKNGVMDSVSLAKPLPQPMGRTVTNYMPASPSWLSYHSIQPIND